MEWKPKPTDKAPGIENLLSGILGVNRKESISNRECVFCHEEQDLDSFKTELDLKEFHNSGICPTCWDKTFKEDD